MLPYNTICLSLCPHKHAHQLFWLVMLCLTCCFCLSETTFLGGSDTLTLLRGCGSDTFYLLGDLGGQSVTLILFTFGVGRVEEIRYFFVFVCVGNLFFVLIIHLLIHTIFFFVYCEDVYVLDSVFFLFCGKTCSLIIVFGRLGGPENCRLAWLNAG